MATDVTQILLNAQSPDGNIRKIAEGNIHQLQEQNIQAFFLSLSTELADNGKPAETRRLAGLILKNALDARDAIRKEELFQRWLSLPSAFRVQIKNALLSTLASPVHDARHTSSQVVAKVAAIEIPRQEWTELVNILLENVAAPKVENPALLKQATLETLGYVCEEVSSTAFQQPQVNSILTAVVQGMKSPDGNNDVCLAATRALNNALTFAQTNFENENERNYIMTVICETTLSTDARIRQAAFECLVSICSIYYEKLSPYMQDIFNITSKAVKTDEESVALQAIEFWSSICDEEIDLAYESESGDSQQSGFQFIKHALPVLVPMLLETLTKQEEDQDQDEGAWNLAMAGGTCLGLVARTVGDDIVPLVMPYVQGHISKDDWRCREAATYAFGSILEGPSVENLTQLVHTALGFILNALKDQNSQVRDTTAWTISRIFEFLHGPGVQTSVINPTNLPGIIAALLESIKDLPNVAEKVCGALYFLAQGYEHSSTDTNPLSPYFPDIIGALLATVDRTDAHDTRLRAGAYETLNEIVRCSTSETTSIIVQLIPVVLERLNNTMQIQIVSSDDREKQSDLQALLCGVLQVIIQKLGHVEQTRYAIQQYADQMMTLFLRVFGCRNATVHEEAMLAIGAFAYATGGDFDKYMAQFSHYLEVGLQNFEEYQVCAVTVGVVGDICRALEDKVLPYCNAIMTLLLKSLSSSSLHRSVKPPIFSCIGDIALAIDGNFENYLSYTMPIIQGGAQHSLQMPREDEEMVDYVNQLRNGIFEAYSGILQGFKNSKSEIMMPHIEFLLNFIEAVSQDKESDESVSKSAAGVLGDVADTLGNLVAQAFKEKSFYQHFLHECIASPDQQVQEAAKWAVSKIEPLLKC